jgi:predicted ATPase
MTNYPVSSRKFIALSGWEGAGKSEGVNHISKQLGFFILPEIARLMFPINNGILNKPLEELSELTFSGYVTGHHVCVANHIDKAIFDRCIIDPLAYQALYSPTQQLCFDGIQRYIDNFNETYGQSALYDDVVLLRHPKNVDFINNVVFADKDRQYSHSIEQYLADARRFEECFMECLSKLDGVANQVILRNAYPENPKILNDLTLLAAGLELGEI